MIHCFNWHLIHEFKPRRFLNLFFIFFLLYFEIMTANLSQGLTVDGVLATVNNEVITLSDYQRFVKETGNTEKKDVVEGALLKRLIDERVILQEAIRRGIEVSDLEVDKKIEDFMNQNNLFKEDLEKALAEEGMSIHTYRRLIKEKIMSLKLIRADIDSRIVIEDKEIEDFYNANKKDSLIPEKVEVDTIFIRLSEGAPVTEITDLKRKVLKIIARLKDGESFDRLIDQYSDGYLKSKEDSLGEFKRGELIIPLENKAFSMRKDEISNPIWVREGVYILKLINKTDERLETVEEVREDIYKHLYKQKRERLLMEWLSTLWGRASITIK